MQSREELCEKIKSIYPDIGTCGMDVDVSFDEERDVWVVHLKKDGHELDTFLEPRDADRCMEGKECVHLGLQVEQLKKNIEIRPE
jgi:hypothetical protein